MVTDSEFKELKQKVVDLENKITYLSTLFADMQLTNCVINESVSCKKEKEHVYDKTKYVFEQHYYCKRELVLTVIKRLIAQYNITKYLDFDQYFPSYLQGSLGVVVRTDVANKYSSAKKRFYFDDQDVIEFEDGLYVVCKEWNSKNIKKFIDRANSVGFSINSIDQN